MRNDSVRMLKLLRGFAASFRYNIATIQPEDLRAYLSGEDRPVAKNNHWRLVAVLFDFAKAEGRQHAGATVALARVKRP